MTKSGRGFNFSDCSLGNLVFAGGFLLTGRHFNRAVDDYCALVGLPAGLIENVTDGTNAWLVALDDEGRLLATEEAIVDVARPNRIREIYLDRSPAHRRRAGAGRHQRRRRRRAARASAPPCCRSIRGWRRRSPRPI